MAWQGTGPAVREFRVAAREHMAQEAREERDVAAGVVLAETFLSKFLVDPDFESFRENLAILDRVLGPFPSEFAHSIELRQAGTFRLRGRVSVVFPPPDVPMAPAVLMGASVRIRDALPLSVSDDVPLLPWSGC